jgi:dTDP-6-deoxy-L-talose 4-dehydrogenase (NAD+)
MTRVLLTGATGFVGRQVLRALLQSGASVTAVVRTARAWPEGASHIVETPDMFAERAAFWAAACTNIDTVAHVAWYAEPGQYLHSPRNLHCLSGTLALAQGAIDARVKRFVGVGTCFEYSLGGDILRPDSPLGPTTPYGAAKAAAWLALSAAFPASGLEFAWCRLFYLYGEGEDSRRLVPYLHARFAAQEPAELTSGAQVRDFLDVAAAGRQIARVVLGEGSGPVNICSGEPVTVGSMARAIAAQYGRPDLVRLGAKPDRADDPPFVLGQPFFPASIPGADHRA